MPTEDWSDIAKALRVMRKTAEATPEVQHYVEVRRAAVSLASALSEAIEHERPRLVPASRAIRPCGDRCNECREAGRQ
ncbi:hypothetical protein GCM10010331_44920 [Streptomyces xanthochromogenes]|nr:hypothetical protein GCM10010331_44920 [Streptomyces xanthochromogenes]